jgi:hypothetical protein
MDQKIEDFLKQAIHSHQSFTGVHARNIPETGFFFRKILVT